MKNKAQATRFASRLTTARITSAGKWTFYYILIGLIAGLGAIVFQYLCQVGLYVFLEMMAGYRPHGPAGETHLFLPSGKPLNPWMLFFLPSLGGLFG